MIIDVPCSFLFVCRVSSVARINLDPRFLPSPSFGPLFSLLHLGVSAHDDGTLHDREVCQSRSNTCAENPNSPNVTSECLDLLSDPTKAFPDLPDHLFRSRVRKRCEGRNDDAVAESS